MIKKSNFIFRQIILVFIFFLGTGSNILLFGGNYFKVEQTNDVVDTTSINTYKEGDTIKFLINDSRVKQFIAKNNNSYLYKLVIHDALNNKVVLSTNLTIPFSYCDSLNDGIYSFKASVFNPLDEASGTISHEMQFEIKNHEDVVQDETNDNENINSNFNKYSKYIYLFIIIIVISLIVFIKKRKKKDEE